MLVVLISNEQGGLMLHIDCKSGPRPKTTSGKGLMSLDYLAENDKLVEIRSWPPACASNWWPDG
jgi:hypothetical protein